MSNHLAFAASSPGFIGGGFSVMPIKTMVICLPLGSRPIVPNVLNCSSFIFFRLVSSANSLATAVSSSSSSSIKPPGKAHLPL